MQGRPRTRWRGKKLESTGARLVQQPADKPVLDVGQQSLLVTLLQHLNQPLAAQDQWRGLWVGCAKSFEPPGDQDQRGTDWCEEIEEGTEQRGIAEQSSLG